MATSTTDSLPKKDLGNMQQLIINDFPDGGEQEKVTMPEANSKQTEKAADIVEQQDTSGDHSASAQPHLENSTAGTTSNNLPSMPAAFSSSLLLDLPPELQEKIIRGFYVPGTSFPKATALLMVSKYVYAVAHPIFLENYQFTCMPLRPSKPARRKYKGEQGDLGRICSKIGMLEGIPLEAGTEWIAGLNKGFKTLFDARQVEDSRKIKSEFERWAPRTFWDDETVGEELAEELAERFVEFAIRDNPNITKLSSMGRKNVARVQHLKIVWGHDEDDDKGIETHYMYPAEVGPYAIGIMGVLCQLWMPNLKSVQMVQDMEHKKVRKTTAIASDHHMLSPRRARETFVEQLGGSRFDNDGGGIPKDCDTVLTLQQFLDACPRLRKLRLGFYKVDVNGPVAWPEWWGEVLRKDGLVLHVQQRVLEEDDHPIYGRRPNMFVFQHVSKLGSGAKESS